MAAAANEPELNDLKQHTLITSYPGGQESELEAASEGGRGWQGRCPAFRAARRVAQGHSAWFFIVLFQFKARGLGSTLCFCLLSPVPPSTPLPMQPV